MATRVVEEFDEVALRVVLEESIEDAFRLADELASEVAAGAERDVVSRLAANYLQARTIVRQCRRVIAVEAGRR